MAKSILEEALLQASQLEEAVKKNAKEILASTMKQEIDELVRESMEDESIEDHSEETEEVAETEVIESEDEVADEEVAEEETEEVSEQEFDIEDESEEDDESEDEDEDEVEDEESEDEVESGMEDIELPSLDLPSLDDEGEEDDDIIDMTDASNEEILKVFKAMGEEDGIIVTQDEDGTVHLEDGDDEYRIEVNENEEVSEEGIEDEVAEEEVIETYDEDGGELAESDEPIYEIEISEEEDGEEIEEGEDAHESDEESQQSIDDEAEVAEEEMEEASRTHAADVRVPSNQGKKYKAGRKDLSEEVEELQTKNTELKEALKVFRDKLNEVGVFNANLAYATRLFTEHTTTKQEKLNILKRFDGVETLKESKSLYKTIKDELTQTDEKLTESVVKKITESPKSGSSEKLVESKTYENPQIRRMKEMMGL